jgi:hypothetical protein
MTVGKKMHAREISLFALLIKTHTRPRKSPGREVKEK